MKVTKLAGQFTPAGFTEYLLQHAAAAGLRASRVFREPLTRGFRRVLEAFDNDPYLVVAATDYLLGAGWPGSERGVSESLVSVGVYDYAIRSMGGTPKPWKYKYYSRFRETVEERMFFRYYLDAIEDCWNAPLGSQPSRWPDVTWHSKESDAFDRLKAASEVIDLRLAKRGFLEEWPTLVERPNQSAEEFKAFYFNPCLLYTSPSPRD